MIRGCWPPRGDRFVVQVASDVGSEIGGRRVAPRLILLQRLGSDGLDIAPVYAVDRAEPHGLVFPNDSRRFVQLPWELIRKAAGQKLEKDHAQRINIASDI